MQAACGGPLSAWPGLAQSAAGDAASNASLDAQFMLDLLRPASGAELYGAGGAIVLSGAMLTPALSSLEGTLAAAAPPPTALALRPQLVAPLALPLVMRCISAAHPPGCNRCARGAAVAPWRG